MRIAIDLTPLLQGGANGGAKIMTLTLIHELTRLLPHCHFILLTSNAELSEWNSFKQKNNVELIPTRPTLNFKVLHPLFNCLGKWGQPLAFLFQQRINKIYQWLYCKKLTKRLHADLLFCPFTAPLFKNLQIPIVSLIYDLQFYTYPFFFTPQERDIRIKNFQNACKEATQLIGISDYVCNTVKHYSEISAHKIRRIYIALEEPPPPLSENTLKNYLISYHVNLENYLLYPANFWRHKNHALLFVAFKLFLTQNPSSSLKLVCTGTDSDHQAFLKDVVKKMGLEGQILFPGYVCAQTFSNLLKGCLALIFPSLYEGFGIPVIEAMQAGKPVLCSNKACLPEITDGAALLFDPTQPEHIVHAITRLTQEPLLREKLITAGKKRAASFGHLTHMAKQYWQVFQETIKA